MGNRSWALATNSSKAKLKPEQDLLVGGVGVGRAYRELSREVPVPASPLADHMTWASRGATPSLSYLFSFMETLSKLGH